MIPKIEFKYSWIYDEYFRVDPRVKKFLKEVKREYPSYNETLNYIKKIKPVWKKHENKILELIQKITGLKWREKKMLVYIVGTCIPFSDPLTIGKRMSDRDFVDTLTHELIHQIQIQDKKFWEKWKRWEKYLVKNYKDESLNTQIHIFVHAVHWKILLKVFNEKRLRENIEEHRKYVDYKKAWKIVEKEGPGNIIKQYKKLK